MQGINTTVIPLRNTSPNDYWELRHALRSLCQHAGITRCVLVGGKPSWYTGEHIPFPDYTADRKEENIRDKVLAAGVDQFLYSNDDMFIRDPVTQVYNKGLLSQTIVSRGTMGSYTRLLKNTFARFGDVPNVDNHYPMYMKLNGVDRTEWPQYGYGFKTTYAQLNGVESIYTPDEKVSDVANVGDGWFSTNDDTKNLQMLAQLYPECSIFEK